MGTSKRATSQAGVSTQPPLVEMLVLLLATTIVLLNWSVGLYTLCPRRKVPTLLCLHRGQCQRTPGSPNRLRHLMGIKLAVGPSSRLETTHLMTIWAR